MRWILIAAFTVAIEGAVALGQQPTTVQLPTFSSFSVDTSVSVPDSGAGFTEAARQARNRYHTGLKPAGAKLGGMQRGREGQGGAGPMSTVLSAGSASVHVTIHEPPRDWPSAARRGATVDLVAEFARAKESSAGRPAMSVPRARQLHLADELTARGDRAKATGNQAAAKVYFESAVRQGYKRAATP
ncbi:MAG: hypothetical protein K1X71_01185 [Pirellulales bacterium]|nr:hypothetical protein [Pirellulales bacterium]